MKLEVIKSKVYYQSGEVEINFGQVQKPVDNEYGKVKDG